MCDIPVNIVVESIRDRDQILVRSILQDIEKVFSDLSVSLKMIVHLEKI
jgi:hypothetical protein